MTLLEQAAARIQLWWLTQKHEPMTQNDARDLAKAAITAHNTWLVEENERLKGLLSEALLYVDECFGDLDRNLAGRIRAALEQGRERATGRTG